MIGKTLNDRYEILEKIGEDNLVEVYKARCNKLNRYVTIKMIKKNCINLPFVLEKLKLEATELAKLSNSNIENIYDVVYQEDLNYMVMEYVIGKTLKDLIVENVRLSYERAVNIAIQIAKVLECAHKSNIIHGNIRPENILITESGTVKVTNFSLIKGDKHLITINLNILLGMVPYLSPEQLAKCYADERSDIYSLGIVMYEMVTGKLPFKYENLLKPSNKNEEETVLQPIELNSSIPVYLNNIIMKSIEKHPNNRYKNASEILVDLLSIQKEFNYGMVSNSIEKDHTQVMPAINIPKPYEEDFLHKQDKDVTKPKVNDKTKNYIVYTLVCILVFIIGIVAVMSIAGIINIHKEGVKAANTVIVPNITEKSKEEAKNLIESIGLVYKEVIENSNEVAEGKVISTNPEMGTSVEKGGIIEVKVSSGVAKKKVPNLIGKYESEAKIIVPQNGFKIGKTKYIRDSRYVRYHVVDQYPKAGEELEEGGVITYTVNLQ